MGRSETESFRSGRVDFFSGNTRHLEMSNGDDDGGY